MADTTIDEHDDPDDGGEGEDQPKRGPGRPPGSRNKKGAGATTTVVTRRTYDGEPGEAPTETDDNPQGGFGALFSRDLTGQEDRIVMVKLIRTEPNHGWVGNIEDPDDATEARIKERWGGGVYQALAVNERNVVVAKRKGIKIWADPLFNTRVEAAQWRQRNALVSPHDPEGAQSQSPLPPPLQLPSDQPSFTQMMALLDQKEERAQRRQEEREDRAMRASRDNQIERDKLQFQAEDRRRRDDEGARQREREHYVQMLEIVRSGQQNQTDPMDTMMKGVTLALKLKDGSDLSEDPNPITTLIKMAPQFLKSAGIGQPSAAPVPEAAATPEGLVLPPALQEKLSTLVGKLVADGHDPEIALSAIMDKVIDKIDRKKLQPEVVAQAQAPAPAPAPEPVPAAPAPAEAPSPTMNGASKMDVAATETAAETATEAPMGADVIVLDFIRRDVQAGSAPPS